MRDFIKLVIQLSKWVPVSELIALFNAARPFPSDWKNVAEVSAWLGRVGITGPLAAAIVAALSKLTPSAVPEAADFESMVRDECQSAGVDPQFVTLILALLKLIFEKYFNKQQDQNDIPPNPAPVNN